MVRFPTKAKYHVTCWKPSTYATCLPFELCQTLLTRVENFIMLSRSRSHRLPPNICYTSTLEVSKNMPSYFYQIILHVFKHNLSLSFSQMRHQLYKNIEKREKMWTHERPWVKKMCGHILVHNRAKKLAMLSNKGWRKNHIMLWSNHDHPTPTHMHTLI